MARRPSDTVQLKLRFPEKLRLRIEQVADRNRHSMNAEIVRRLEQSFEKDDSNARMEAIAQATATAVIEKFEAVGIKRR
jgi:hypothetical protein